jgi:hypothetical protein
MLSTDNMLSDDNMLYDNMLFFRVGVITIRIFLIQALSAVGNSLINFLFLRKKIVELKQFIPQLTYFQKGRVGQQAPIPDLNPNSASCEEGTTFQCVSSNKL